MKNTFRKTAIAMLPFLALALGGCHMATSYTPVAIPKRDVAAKKFVVGKFVQGTRQSTVTENVAIITISEAVQARSISAEFAEALRGAGLPAKANEIATSRSLDADTYLIRGALMNLNARNPDGMAGPIIVTSFTLGILGGVLPDPFPWATECPWRYHVEVVAPNGDVVLTREGKLEQSERSLYIYSQVGRCGDVDAQEEMSAALQQELAGSLVAALRN